MLNSIPPQRFKAGDHVRVLDRPSIGHCRTPVYLRGRSGIIIGVAGRYLDPEKLAYHKPGMPAHLLYRIRFRQVNIWDTYTGTDADDLEADIFEHWLENATKENKK
jgi:nitrile hydratase